MKRGLAIALLAVLTAAGATAQTIAIPPPAQSPKLRGGYGVTLTQTGNVITITFDSSSSSGAGGLTTLNGLNALSQNFAVDSSSNTWKVTSSGSVHTFGFPGTRLAYLDKSNTFTQALTALHNLTVGGLINVDTLRNLAGVLVIADSVSIAGAITAVTSITASGTVNAPSVGRNVTNSYLFLGGDSADGVTAANIELYGSTHALAGQAFFDAGSHTFRSANSATTFARLTSGSFQVYGSAPNITFTEADGVVDDFQLRFNATDSTLNIRNNRVALFVARFNKEGDLTLGGTVRDGIYNIYLKDIYVGTTQFTNGRAIIGATSITASGTGTFDSLRTTKGVSVGADLVVGSNIQALAGMVSGNTWQIRQGFDTGRLLYRSLNSNIRARLELVPNGTPTQPSGIGFYATDRLADGTNYGGFTIVVDTTAMTFDVFQAGFVTIDRNISINADLYPTSTNARDLGRSHLVWDSLYVQHIQASGKVSPGGVTTEGALGVSAVNDTVRWTGQGGTISAQNFANTTTGKKYLLTIYANTTTTGTGTATVTVGWNDGAGAKTYTTAAFDLSSTANAGMVQDVVTIYVGSGTPTWSTSATVTGGTPAYAVNVALLREW